MRFIAAHCRQIHGVILRAGSFPTPANGN